MDMLHISIDGSLTALILLLPVIGVALGWCLRDMQSRKR